MTTLYLRDSNIHIKIEKSQYSVFTAVVSTLKSLRCRYNAKTQEWLAPIYKYEDIKERLSDIDVLEDTVDTSKLTQLAEGEPEQETEKIRRIPDYSIMNFPPIIGKAPYENFQHDAIKNCISRSRYACYFGMGSGKSYIAAATIAHRLYKYHDCAKVIFITSSIGVRNLEAELQKFIKDLDTSRIAVANKDFRNPFDRKDLDIVILNYNTWRLICNYYKNTLKIKSKLPRKPFLPLKEWSDGKDIMLILDESHNIANPSSQQSSLLLLHAPLFKYRYEFTGSPADKPEKMYAQYLLLDKYLVYNLSFNSWKDKMAVIGDRFSPYAIKEWKKDELEKQNQRFLSSYGVYHKTTDLIDLPNYNEKKVYLTMTPVHRKIYEQLVIQDLPSSGFTRDIVNRFPYIMLGVDNPFLLDKHRDKFDLELNGLLDKFKPSYLEKLNALDDIISDHPDDKIIVWAIHPSTINMIGDYYSSLHPICITGETEQDERFKLVEEFKKGHHKLLVANITCLNTSVTITESRVQVFVERGFNYTSYIQSTQRIYRIGQNQDVISYILLYKNSLDILSDKNLTSKGLLCEHLSSKDFLTQEQWIQIFNANESDNFDF